MKDINTQAHGAMFLIHAKDFAVQLKRTVFVFKDPADTTGRPYRLLSNPAEALPSWGEAIAAVNPE